MKTSTTREAGSTLPAALLIIFVACVIVGIATAMTNNIARNTQANAAVQADVSVGDGALEYVYAQWRQICKAKAAADPAAVPTTSDFSGITLPAGFPNTDPSIKTLTTTITNLSVVAVDPLLHPLATAFTTPPKQSGRGPGSYAYSYLASADVTTQAVSRPVTQKVRRVFQKKAESPWNFAVFYQDLLEIHPSQPLTLTGWVHTNDSAYTATDKLTLTDRLTMTGSWNVAYAPGDNRTGAVSPIYPPNEPPATEDPFQAFGIDSTAFNKTDANPNNDGYRELVEVPDSSFPDPLSPPAPTVGATPPTSQRYYNLAGIKVVINSTVRPVTKRVYNGAGVECTAGSPANSNDLKIYNAILGSNGALKGPNTFQDNREGALMSVWDIDMGLLNSGGMTWNNIFYITDIGGSSTSHIGVRVKNAASLPATTTGTASSMVGLTFVTDNPLYIWGDWNTGGSPASNTVPDPTKPMAATYKWRPSAILADAITLLSNNWLDANSTKVLSARQASNTTVNAALLSGNVPTTSGSYSGGAENFVRLLEDWTGKT
ncbi:MAG: hypothetical protein ABR526_14130, partial [Chthoniobacterales bacterium]